MRCILTGCLGVALGWTAVGQTQEPGWRPGPALDGRKPTVTLGPPTVALGAPRAVPAPAAGLTPCGFVARGKADDKAPLPAGPALPKAPEGGTSSPLPAPTPMSPASPLPPGAIVSGPVTSGPISSDMIVPGGAMPGAPCPTCDPSWAPLPGGSFVADSCPCGHVLYGSAEYLLWWTKGSNLPPLLTATNPATGTTTLLFGNETVDDQLRSGGRFTVGGWLNACQNWGVVGSFFFLANHGTEFSATAGDGMVLARPYIDPFTTNGSNIVVGPGPQLNAERLSAFTASTSTQLWGADINARKNIWCGCAGRLDALAGFRFLRLKDSLNISETTAVPAMVIPGTGGLSSPAISASLMDRFATANNFYGGQVGLIGELKRGPWSLDTTVKVALGDTHQTVTAMGSQMGTLNGVPFTGPGLLVQPSNAGSRSRNEFSVVPEVGLNLGYQVTQHFKVFVGYDFLYWNNVVRPGDQIDPVLNVQAQRFNLGNGQSIPVPPITQRPGDPARPMIQFRDSDFWAQGINVGLQFTW